jgi:hypothetical protein
MLGTPDTRLETELRAGRTGPGPLRGAPDRQPRKGRLGSLDPSGAPPASGTTPALDSGPPETPRDAHLEPLRTPPASYQELRIRSRGDRRRRHLPAGPARATGTPRRSGFSSCPSRFESRPPGATLCRRPDGRGRPAGDGSRNPCHTSPQGRPRLERTRQGQHVLTDVSNSQSKDRMSSWAGENPPLPV